MTTRYPGSGADLELVQAPATERGPSSGIHLARFGRTLCNRRTGLAWAIVSADLVVTCSACNYLKPRESDHAA